MLGKARSLAGQLVHAIHSDLIEPETARGVWSNVGDIATWFGGTITLSDEPPTQWGGLDPANDARARPATREAQAPANNHPSAPDLRQALVDLLPRKVRVADKPEHGVVIRSSRSALEWAHIGPNPPYEHGTLAFDIDRPGAVFAAYDANLPQATWIVENPENGHAHVAYRVAHPVLTHEMAHARPLWLLAAIQRSYTRALGADPAFTGGLTKNPLHPRHRLYHWSGRTYTLAELADGVLELDTRARRRREHVFGLSRNCDLFRELGDQFAYSAARKFKAAGAQFADWEQRLIIIANEMNCEMFIRYRAGANVGPLPFNEVRQIARSVAKWTWRRFSPEGFSRRQSRLGKRAMAKRWAGHVSVEKTKPWAAMGISRRTWYRRKHAGTLEQHNPIEWRFAA